jgi:hypothetical protein
VLIAELIEFLESVREKHGDDVLVVVHGGEGYGTFQAVRACGELLFQEGDGSWSSADMMQLDINDEGEENWVPTHPGPDEGGDEGTMCVWVEC